MRLEPYPDEFGIGQAKCAAHSAETQRDLMARVARDAFGKGYVPPPVRSYARKIFPDVAAEYARARLILAQQERRQ